MRTFVSSIAVVMFVATFSGPAQAGLLTGGDEKQLEYWLGEGSLDFTLLYQKLSGHTSADFHAAVDGQGRTFTVMTARFVSVRTIIDKDPNTPDETITEYSPWQLVGGYNPLSWSSIEDFHYSVTDAERTAFLFNLTDRFVQRQLPVVTGPKSDPSGLYQTWNSASSGPAFGLSDLWVNQDLNTGDALSRSYGQGKVSSSLLSLGDLGLIKGDSFSIEVGELEVYSIAPRVHGVPEPSSLSLLATGGFVVAMRHRRRQRKRAE